MIIVRIKTYKEKNLVNDCVLDVNIPIEECNIERASLENGVVTEVYYKKVG